jgi:hypothetical protein
MNFKVVKRISPASPPDFVFGVVLFQEKDSLGKFKKIAKIGFEFIEPIPSNAYVIAVLREAVKAGVERTIPPEEYYEEATLSEIELIAYDALKDICNKVNQSDYANEFYDFRSRVENTVLPVSFKGSSIRLIVASVDCVDNDKKRYLRALEKAKKETIAQIKEREKMEAEFQKEKWQWFLSKEFGDILNSIPNKKEAYSFIKRQNKNVLPLTPELILGIIQYHKTKE